MVNRKMSTMVNRKKAIFQMMVVRPVVVRGTKTRTTPTKETAGIRSRTGRESVGGAVGMIRPNGMEIDHERSNPLII